MKKQVIFTVIFLLTTTLACSLVSSLGGDAGDSSDAQEPSSAPGAESDSSSEHQESGIGPEMLDLSAKSLYLSGKYPAYKMSMNMQYEGVDTAGSPKVFNLDFYVENQEDPKAQRIVIGEGEQAEGIEMVVLGDQVMSVFPGFGCSVFPASSMEGENPEENIPDLSELLTGQAKLAETGVDVDGVMTDRYELTSENMTDSGVAGVPKVSEGYLFVARDGGHIVRLEMSGIANTEENGFDPNTETQVFLQYTFIPVENGSLVISPPADCADQVSGISEYPVMDGASEISAIQGMVFYTVDNTMQEVLNFYKGEMEEQGYELTQENGGSDISLATLEFTKDGTTVQVTAIQNGDTVSVTVNEK